MKNISSSVDDGTMKRLLIGFALVLAMITVGASLLMPRAGLGRPEADMIADVPP